MQLSVKCWRFRGEPEKLSRLQCYGSKRRSRSRLKLCPLILLKQVNKSSLLPRSSGTVSTCTTSGLSPRRVSPSGHLSPRWCRWTWAVAAPEQQKGSGHRPRALWPVRPYLDERAVVAVPHDALHAALWAVPEPQPQLLEVHRWRISHCEAPMWHQAVHRLLLTPQLW